MVLQWCIVAHQIHRVWRLKDDQAFLTNANFIVTLSTQVLVEIDWYRIIRFSTNV